MNWNKCNAYQDKEYVKLRNSLINQAANNADKLAHFIQLPHESTLAPLSGQSPENVRWNRYFLGEMDRLFELHYAKR